MYSRKCKICGTVFETRTYRKEKCKPDCGRQRRSHPGDEKRRVERENHEVEFIGVDGEGINQTVWEETYDEETRDIVFQQISRHQYVLLSIGDQSLHRNGDELTHEDIFAFLWEQYEEHPTAAFVGFFLGYDFTEWLKSLSADTAWSLLSTEGIYRRTPIDSERPFPFPVADGPWETIDGHRGKNAKWEFDILANKRFKLRPYVRPELVPLRPVKRKDGTVEYVKVVRPWMYICDSGPFFQTSFLNAINPKDWSTPIVSQAEYDRIEIGKTHRQDAAFDADMIEYNILENEVMARLMTTLNEGFVSDDIRLRKDQWFGPGQAAQTWMRNIGVPAGEDVREAVPKYARDAARNTYFGGWFEIFAHGLVPGTTYSYDINSAYPAVIANLPCLLHGRWTHGKGRPPRRGKKTLRIIHATISGNDRFVGPMPHRDVNGNILRPSKTKGWYWQHEVDASKRAKLWNKIDIHSWVDYDPCACDPPMASIRQLYEGRLSVGKKTPSGKAKKLVYNSSYGKLAQSVGVPKFANAIWASLITAGCRTTILDAIATHPTKTRDLLMIATDGIVFRTPHPSLDVHPTRLGAWEEDTYENLSLFMPGLYWHDASRESIRQGARPDLKSRGVNPKDLGKIIDRVDYLWSILYTDRDFPEEKTGAPAVRLNVDWALITAKQAVARDQWWTCGQVVYGAERAINANPSTKRDYSHGFMPEYEKNDIDRIWRSRPYTHADPLESRPYDRGFGEPQDNDDVGSMVTPDGDVGDLLAWQFRLRQ